MPAHGLPVRRLLAIGLAVVAVHALGLWVVERSTLARAPADASVQRPALPPVSARLVLPLTSVAGQAAGASPTLGAILQPPAQALGQSPRKAGADLAPPLAKPTQANSPSTGLALAPPSLPTTAPVPALSGAQGSPVAPAVSLSARDATSGAASGGVPLGALPGNEPDSANATTNASTGARAASSNSNASTGATKAVGTPAARIQLPSSDADYLRNPQPEYPPLSRQRGEHGRVVLNVLIGTDGSAQKAEILSSSGFDRLDQAALRTVRGWRFEPGKRSGVPEAMWFAVPIQFVLQ